MTGNGDTNKPCKWQGTKMQLDFDILTGAIKDKDGRIILPEEARRLWEEKKVTRPSYTFKVLAKCEFDVDLAKIKCKGWTGRD